MQPPSLLTWTGHSLSWLTSRNIACAMPGTKGLRLGWMKEPTGSPPKRYTSLPSSWLSPALIASGAKNSQRQGTGSLQWMAWWPWMACLYFMTTTMSTNPASAEQAYISTEFSSSHLLTQLILLNQCLVSILLGLIRCQKQVGTELWWNIL